MQSNRNTPKGMTLIAEAIEFVEGTSAEIRFRPDGGEITSATAFELAHRFNVHEQLVEACAEIVALIDAERGEGDTVGYCMVWRCGEQIKALRVALLAARGGK